MRIDNVLSATVYPQLQATVLGSYTRGYKPEAAWLSKFRLCVNFIGDYLGKNKEYTFLRHLIDETASAAISKTTNQRGEFSIITYVIILICQFCQLNLHLFLSFYYIP